MISTSPMSEAVRTPTHVFVCGLIGITIQLLRCSIQLVLSATAKQKHQEAKLKKEEKKKSSEKQRHYSKHHHHHGQQQHHYHGHYGSVDDYDEKDYHKKFDISLPGEITIRNDIMANHQDVDEEGHSLLLRSSSVTRSSQPYPYWITIFRLIWCCYWILFLVIAVLERFNTYFVVISIIPPTGAVSNALLGIKAWFFALECLYYVFMYDGLTGSISILMAHRHNALQRFLQTAASIFLWCCVALQILYTHHYNNHLEKHLETDITNADVFLITVLTLAVLLTLVQGCLAESTARKIIMDDNDDDERKRRSTSVLSVATALRPLLKPYFWPDSTARSAFANRIRAVTTWFCVIGSKFCGLVSPLYLGWASTALAHSQWKQAIQYSVLYCAISWLGGTLKECQSLVYLKVAQAAFVELSETAFGHLHSLSLDWHLRKKSGEVIRSMDRGIAACDTLMKYLFLWLIPALVECFVVCIIFATYFSYLPLAVTVFYFVFAYILWTILVTIWRKQLRNALTKHDNEWHDRFTDSLINSETVKFFTAETYQQEKFAEAVSNFQTGSLHVQASLSLLNISQQLLLKICLAVSLAMTAYVIQRRFDCCVQVAGCDSGISDCCQSGIGHTACNEDYGMQVGDFVAVLMYTLNLFTPLNFLGSVYNAVVMSIMDLSSMADLLAETPEVKDAPDALTLPAASSDNDTVVEFDNVFFNYPTQPETNGLQGLSFEMKRGTTTAIVGATGAGKTTVSRLLFRFYDVLGGGIRVNGVDVRSVTQNSLRKAIGIVPQTASIFNDTIRNNILYGRRDATEEEVKQAVKDAQLLGFIESLDSGFETLVGDRGLKLSAGERQRAAIARCLLQDPSIVVLDEATSALDTLTEKSVQEALDRLSQERTVLVIAHRLGTIQNADNIIFLKDGLVAEQGTHDELLAKNGLYAEMWHMQIHSTSLTESKANLEAWTTKLN